MKIRLQTVFVRRVSLFALMVGSPFTALRTDAQSATAGNAPVGARPKENCFRGREEPVCDRFWLTEFGVAAPVLKNGKRITPQFVRLGTRPNDERRREACSRRCGVHGSRASRQWVWTATALSTLAWRREESGCRSRCGRHHLRDRKFNRGGLTICRAYGAIADLANTA